MRRIIQWAGILWLGSGIDAGGIVIWAIALQGSEVSYLVNFTYATPVLAMIFFAVLLKETVNLYSCAGLILILGGFSCKKRQAIPIIDLSVSE